MFQNLHRVPCALAAVGLLLAANVVVPLLWGDVYPFTSAPMFRDSPQQCCNYRVVAADGSELPPDDWLLQRVYDGNPLAYGVGICPPAVIEQQFGIIHDEAAVRRHIERQFELPRHQLCKSVEVIQEVIGPIDDRRVGVIRAARWRIALPAIDATTKSAP
jgi:hypothetical protein